MFSRFSASTTPIGIDIGVRSIKAVQLRNRKGKFELFAGVTLPRDPSPMLDEQALKQLARVLERNGFHGREVVLACPPAHLQSAIFELPPASSGAPLKEIAEMEMRRACKLESREIELAWWELPASSRQSGGTSVMAVAAPHDVSESMASSFLTVGLDVVAIDTIASALARSSGLLSGDALSAVVDLGAEAGTIALTMSGRVIYERTVADIGIDILRRSVIDELRLEEDEADCVLASIDASAPGVGESGPVTPRRLRLRSLVLHHLDAICQEVESSLTFAAHRYSQFPVAHVLLCGGGASIAGLIDELSHRFRTPSSILTPDRLFGTDNSVDGISDSPRHTIAAGLAMNTASC